MRDHGVGFFHLRWEGKLIGKLTDADIAVRAVADGAPASQQSAISCRGAW